MSERGLRENAAQLTRASKYSTGGTSGPRYGQRRYTVLQSALLTLSTCKPGWGKQRKALWGNREAQRRVPAQNRSAAKKNSATPEQNQRVKQNSLQPPRPMRDISGAKPAHQGGIAQVASQGACARSNRRRLFRADVRRDGGDGRQLSHRRRADAAGCDVVSCSGIRSVAAS
jgi:hypothetical protein